MIVFSLTSTFAFLLINSLTDGAAIDDYFDLAHSTEMEPLIYQDFVNPVVESLTKRKFRLDNLPDLFPDNVGDKIGRRDVKDIKSLEDRADDGLIKRESWSYAVPIAVSLLGRKQDIHNHKDQRDFWGDALEAYEPAITDEVTNRAINSKRNLEDKKQTDD